MPKGKVLIYSPGSGPGGSILLIAVVLLVLRLPLPLLSFPPFHDDPTDLLGIQLFSDALNEISRETGTNITCIR